MARAMPKFTKTPPELVAAFESARPADPRVTKKTMFGYPAYFLDGKMFAFTFGPRVAARVDDRRLAKMGKAGGAFEIMPGRPMKEYVEVPSSEMQGAALKRWIADALAAAERLPPGKTAATKTTATKKSTKKTAKKVR